MPLLCLSKPPLKRMEADERARQASEGMMDVEPAFVPEALSIQARLQSMRPAQCRRCSSSWCRRLQTPASCQSRSRRQHVTPEPQPISWGSISQGMPERSTNRMPVSAARLATRGRPPLGLGGSAGSKGWTMDQSSSLTSALFMPLSYGRADEFLGFERHS